MKICVFKTPQEVDLFVGKHMIDFVKTHERPVLGFATGSTPLGTYDYLIDQYQKGVVSYHNVIAFNLDEYVGVAKTHPRSFARFMKEYLFDNIDIQEKHVFAINGDAKDINQECQQYEQCIANHPIDIQVLGIGMDGHIAYNEPGSSFDSVCHVVDLHPESIESSLDYGFDTIEEVPSQGVTQGISTIMKAKQLIMMAKGKKKAVLVEKMLNGEITEDFPSSIIQKHENVIVVLDQEAASCLKEEEYERC